MDQQQSRYFLGYSYFFLSLADIFFVGLGQSNWEVIANITVAQTFVLELCRHKFRAQYYIWLRSYSATAFPVQHD